MMISYSLKDANFVTQHAKFPGQIEAMLLLLLALQSCLLEPPGTQQAC